MVTTTRTGVLRTCRISSSSSSIIRLRSARRCSASSSSCFNSIRRSHKAQDTRRVEGRHQVRSAPRASTSATELEGSEETPKVKIVFSTEYILGEGEKVFLVGEDDILGAWNPLSAVALSCVKDRKLWQTSVLLNKGSSYEFKFIAVRDGKYVRWQDGSNRLINIPTTVPSDCGFVAFVPWEGETSVSTEGDTLEEDALDSLTALQLKVVEDMDSSPQFTRAKIEELRDMASNEEESISEANSRAVDAAVNDLGSIIDEAESIDDPTSLLELDLQVAAASRRVVITMELMQEQELKKQLTSGSDDKTPSEVE